MISTSFDYKKILKIGVSYVVKYSFILTVAILAGLFIFTVTRINALSDPVTDNDYLIQTLSGYKEVSIDEETVEKIKQLVESDIEINAEFNSRENPFSEN